MLAKRAKSEGYAENDREVLSVGILVGRLGGVHQSECIEMSCQRVSSTRVNTHLKLERA